MSNNSKSLSLYDIFDFVRESYALLKRKWKLIALISITMGGLTFLYASLKAPLYDAVLTFSVEDKGGGSMYSAVASQFGIDLSRGEGGAFKGDNIIEVFKSQTVIEQALLVSYEMDGVKTTLIDRFLKVYPMLGEQAGDSSFFPVVYDDRSKYSRSQDSVLHIVSETLQKYFIEIEKVDKKLTIIKLSIKSKDEKFSQFFAESLGRTVYKLFIDSKVEKLRSNINLLENRIDSVKAELNNEMLGAASSQDQNQNAALARVKVPYLQRQLNVQLLTNLHMELVKNLELSKLTLAKEEPLVQVIDRPIPPLKVIRMSGVKYGLLVTVATALLIFTGVIATRTIRRAFSTYMDQVDSGTHTGEYHKGDRV
jgi:uncharacterized protein involved in exopolysaccharide biosynthesis